MKLLLIINAECSNS